MGLDTRWDQMPGGIRCLVGQMPGELRGWVWMHNERRWDDKYEMRIYGGMRCNEVSSVRLNALHRWDKIWWGK